MSSVPPLSATSMPIQKCFGFSLLEILAAIAVLGLLVSLLIPGINSTMDKGKSAKCLANLRQIGIAMNLFVSENSQEFPRLYDGVTITTPWMWQLIPYTDMASNSMGQAPLPRAAGIFVCPAYKPSVNRGAAYGVNGFISPASGFNKWNFKRLVVPEPSKTILVVEMDKNGEALFPTASASPSRRHPSDSANFLFVDSHVESITGNLPSNDPRWKW